MPHWPAQLTGGFVTKSLLRAALLVLASLLANHAHAAACVAGSVAAVANTSCTIGDLSFTFGAASIRDDSHLSGVTTAALTFTPNVGVGTEVSPSPEVLPRHLVKESSTGSA